MHVRSGTYRIRISPKSGRPVFGHIEVNSGQLIAISYSRSGRGFGNVSSVTAIRIHSRQAIDILLSARLRYRPLLTFLPWGRRARGSTTNAETRARARGNRHGRRPAHGQDGALRALRGEVRHEAHFGA